MRKARELIHSLGGAEKCNSFTKFYFAALGQISYDACPTIPPEIVLLPKWFYFNLYHVSAWTRTMILPLALVTTLRPVRNLPRKMGIGELYLDHEAANRLADPLHGLPHNWRDLFLRVDQLLKVYEQCPLQFLRDRAMRESEKWLLEHLDNSEGLGAIFPPMVYILIVFRALGYPEDHPRVVAGHKHLKDFYIREGNTIRLQPCVSPVWDTGIALHALAAAEISESSREASKATDWLLSKECLEASDWRKNCPAQSPADGSSNSRIRIILMSMTPRWSRWRCAKSAGCEPGLRSRAASTGSWPCRTTTAAGPHSIGPGTARSSKKSPSPITTRCRTRVARTSPAGCSNASATAD